jgi:hypothetical protein
LGFVVGPVFSAFSALHLAQRYVIVAVVKSKPVTLHT